MSHKDPMPPPHPPSVESASNRLQDLSDRVRVTVAEMERNAGRVRHELSIKLSKYSDLGE